MDNNLAKNTASSNKMLIGVSTGLVIVVTIGLFLLFPMKNSSSPLKNLFAAAVTLSKSFIKGEELTLSSDTVIVFEGELFTLSWQHIGKKNSGSYLFSYNCFPDVAISAVHLNEIIPINCDSPYYFFSEDNTITLRGSAKNIIELPLIIAFIKNGESVPSIKGTIIVSIVPKAVKLTASKGSTNGGIATRATSTPGKVAASQPVKKPAPTPAKKTNPPAVPPKTLTAGTKTGKTFLISGGTPTVSNPLGMADLMVKILEIGAINLSDNSFVSTSTLKSSDRIAVRFEVANIGTKESGDWYFNAVLPTFPWHIFTSPGQTSLAPNEKVEFVIGFNKIEKADNNEFKINVDPANSLKELNETNNFASTTINGVRFQ